MNCNQELTLSLLNLFTSYVNLQRNTTAKAEARKILQPNKLWRKQYQVVNGKSGASNAVLQQKEIQNKCNASFTSSASAVDFERKSIIVTIARDSEKGDLLRSCEATPHSFPISDKHSQHLISNSKQESPPKTKMEIKAVGAVSKHTRGVQRKPHGTRRVRRWRVRPINMDRFRTGYHRKVFINVKQMEEHKFFEHTRMSKSLFDWLLSFAQTSLKKSRQIISAEERLVLTLNYLAYGTSLQSLAWKHKVGKSTARQIVLDTCNVLWNLLSPIYFSEPSASMYADIADEFKSNFKIPNCVGAIDGKHVSIRIPHTRNNSSIIILGACDTKHKFSAISVGNYNNQSDNGVFQFVSAENVIISEKLPLPSNKPLSQSCPPFPYFFISGTSFSLQKNIMRPYVERNLDEKKKMFNHKISVGRAITENTFGILTARFRVLLTTIEFFPETSKTIILACIALHNYIMTNDDKQLYCPDNFIDRVNEFGVTEEGQWRTEITNNGDKPISSISSSHRRSTYEAVNLRDILANFFCE